MDEAPVVSHPAIEDVPHSDERGATGHPGAGATYGKAPWGSVVLLAIVVMMNIVDRTLPAVLGELIKRDLSLSDTMLGLINGFGFLVIYSIAALPVARLADRRGYGSVIAGCVAIWSLLTILGGVVVSGWQLALTRTGVALGEAGVMPAAQAFISNQFPPAARARPMAILSLSAPLSLFGAMAVGGILGQAVGWRRTFLVLGVASLLFALLVRVVLGRTRSFVDGASQRSLSSAVGTLLRKRSYCWIMLGSALVGIAAYTINTFNTPFLMRVHGFTVAQVGVRYGIILATVGSLLLIGIGSLIDRLTRRDPRWTLWLLSGLFAALLPVMTLSLLVRDHNLSLVLMAIGACAGIGYLVPTIVAIHRLAEPELRGTSSALMLLGVSLTGGLGPLAAGMISDALTPSLGATGLARAMLIVPVAFAGASLSFLAATRSYVRDLVDEPA